MHLYDLPLVLALIGLAFYTVLAGADFGAGFWQLIAGKGKQADEIRDHAYHAMAPVWEANHVWLIFVLTVVWTAYPIAFRSIASTLSIPLFVAGIGIVLRGGAYALRAVTATTMEEPSLDSVVPVSSILTPFALRTDIRALGCGRALSPRSAALRRFCAYGAGGTRQRVPRRRWPCRPRTPAGPLPGARTSSRHSRSARRQPTTTSWLPWWWRPLAAGGLF